MSAKEKWKWVYKVVRSVLFTSILAVAFLFVLLYVLLSVPAVQNNLKNLAERELSALFTSELKIERLSIYPFNEIVVEGVVLYEPDTQIECARIKRLGAGISLWRLISDRKIVINYVELLGLDATLRQEKPNAPLNIDFLIQAFKPKDKSKPPTAFDLEIRNIVVRQCQASFSRPWIAEESQKFPGYRVLKVDSLNADVLIPRLKNDDIDIDLRRLEFVMPGLTSVKNLSCRAHVGSDDLVISDIELRLPNTLVLPSDINLPLHPEGGMGKYLLSSTQSFSIDMPRLRLSDLAFLYAPLRSISADFLLHLDGGMSGGNLSLSNFRLATIGHYQGDAPGVPDNMFSLSLNEGGAAFFCNTGKSAFSLSSIYYDDLKIDASASFLRQVNETLRLSHDNPGASLNGEKVGRILNALSDFKLSSKGSVDFDSELGKIEVSILSGAGDLELEGEWHGNSASESISLSLLAEDLQLGRLLNTTTIESVSLNLDADIELSNAFRNLKDIKNWKPEKYVNVIRHADIDLNVPEALLDGYRLDEVDFSFNKDGGRASFSLNSNDENFNLSVEGDALLAGADSSINLEGDILRLHPGVIAPLKRKLDFDVSGELVASIHGNNIDNAIGHINLQRLNFKDLSTGRLLQLDSFELISRMVGSEREYTLLSDWIEGGIRGNFNPSEVPKVIQGMLSEALPEYIRAPRGYADSKTGDNSFTFDFSILRGGSWGDFLQLPVKLLYEVNVSGELDGLQDELRVNVEAPYLQQGRDKLIRGLKLSGLVGSGDADLNLNIVYPTKKGDLHLISELRSRNGNLFGGFDFNPERTTGFFGHLDLEAAVSNSISPLGKMYSLHVLPGKLYLNNAEWNVADAWIRYLSTSHGSSAEIKGFSISHGSQFVTIDGLASSNPADEIVARLNEVDLDYIFDTLNINYVHFGGLATGQAVGASLFTPSPIARTEGLFVKDLSYNNAVLGDAQLHGDFDLKRKRVGIKADIAEEGRHVALVDGGIWIGRDSLSFDIDAEKVRIDFLYPFMQAFASKVEGRASGKAKLYGTFSDIDMTGRLFADTITVGVAYTNVCYSGRDSVMINPGRIIIPSFTLSDQFGHTAKLEGELTHRYFHNPKFDFKVSEAADLLLYDTNSSMNPIWYGRIFGTGNGRIRGNDDFVGISADMTTEENSNFTFVLSDRQDALEYNFLTFTDKRKERQMAELQVDVSEEDEILKAFRKQVKKDDEGSSTMFGMDIRATITPATRLNLIMDPVSGDYITANGAGAMNLTYRSDTDDLKMFGKYVLEEGVYKFSLQDLILKDFIIKEGSSISFNGDPMAGILDIRAAYRVNTNLADLDQSFALDRDLNRTNVPVDAMLLVNGEMSHPDISFDIELPTLNDEVEQKVRSVISSDDMMNLQMIYLLGLNRFYTPEYMGGSSGGEWASVASSTISSQLQNIIGQLTDKVSVLPSFKSDKGDFSDIEVDVALSSRLFNNRLLINGNFGYRDPSTSSTTFIGDFDIEYLLNRQGNWRLKAYNHFNDQNYYLRSALTTQGVGIVWRRDFNHIFGINKPRETQKTVEPVGALKPDSIPSDSIQ